MKKIFLILVITAGLFSCKKEKAITIKTWAFGSNQTWINGTQVKVIGNDYQDNIILDKGDKVAIKVVSSVYKEPVTIQIENSGDVLYKNEGKGTLTYTYEY